MRRKILMAGIFIALLILTGITFLLYTEAGLQWLVTRAVHSVSGLSINSAQGRLSGPFKIHGIQYKADQQSFEVDDLSLDWDPARLMHLEARISSLKADGVRITLPPGQDSDGEAASSLPELNVPLKIILDQADISNIVITEKGAGDFVTIHRISMQARVDDTGVSIRQLDMEMPELSLTANGDIDPRGDYPLRITASWALRLTDFEEISGQGEVAGTLKHLRVLQDLTRPSPLSMDMTISNLLTDPGWEGDVSFKKLNPAKLNKTWPELDLSGTVTGSGSMKHGDISSFSVHLLEGELKGSGSLSWKPEMRWVVKIDSERLNPGAQWPKWQGALKVAVQSSGHYEKGVLTVNPSHVSAQGSLRNRPLDVRAELSLSEDVIAFSGLEIRSSKSLFSASGTVADSWSLKWDSRILDAGDFAPGLQGVIQGTGSVTGSRSHPVIKGDISGTSLAFDTYTAESVKVFVDLDMKDERASRVDINAKNLSAGGQKFNTITLNSSGMVASHSIAMKAGMDTQTMALAMTGGYKDKTWSGLLTELLLEAGRAGTWSLREPVSVSLSRERAAAEPLCLVSSTTDLCLQASWTGAKGAEGRITVNNLPLSALKSQLPRAVEAEGFIHGTGDFAYLPEGVLSGKGSLTMPGGKLSYQGNDKPVDISLGESRIDFNLDKSALDADIELLLPERGHIKGAITLPGFIPGITEPASQRIVGNFTADLNNLDLVPVFIEQIPKASGSAAAQISISGTLAETVVTGETIMKDGNIEIPDLGIQLRDIYLTVTGNESGVLNIKGKLSSGSGYAAIQGTVDLHREKGPSADIQVQGENFEAVKVPGAWILVSPDINLKVRENSIDFSGSLIIPEARVEPPDISGAVLPSKDVTVVDMPVAEQKAGWSVTGRLKLSLGDKVTFKGFGLTSRVTGGIDLTEQPGMVTQGRGEFQIVEGQYRAYGQDLAIDNGRLVFAGIMDDPGLDIRAFRKVKDVTAGVNIQGTLRAPELQVYSSPAMDESDALSYILFGRPMKQLSGSEGNQLYGAALSAGLSAGGFVAKKIGAAFGIEDVEIEKGDAPEQATLFIGKYLSPRLYLSYGIGLFEPVSTIRLRYDLTKQLQVQTEYGIESSGDMFYTIER